MNEIHLTYETQWMHAKTAIDETLELGKDNRVKIDDFLMKFVKQSDALARG